jgi:hypothetical protein
MRTNTMVTSAARLYRAAGLAVSLVVGLSSGAMASGATVAPAGGAGAAGGAAGAASASVLGAWFGFLAPRTIVLERDAGPVITGDFNGDGLPDIGVVNNSKSRIELYLLRKAPKTLEELERDAKVNQLRPTEWYDRKDISLSQRVTALRAIDIDADGKLDLVYSGASPGEIVALRQIDSGEFKVMARQRVRELAARQSTFRIGDVMGGPGPEVVTVAEERIVVFPLNRDGTLGEARRLNPGKPVGGLMLDDYTGDGMTDIMAIVGDEQMPMRLWLQRQDPRTAAAASAGGAQGSKAAGAGADKRGLLGAELRFELPSVRAADHAVFPGKSAASIGVIERLSRRVVFYDVASTPVEQIVGRTSGEGEAQAEVFGFSDGANKDRSVVTIDLDQDGMTDLLATDSKTNTIAFYRQSAGIGLGDPENFSSFKATKQLAAAGPKEWDDSPTPTVFALSEEEKAVGVARWDAQAKRLSFPTPVAVKTDGANPVALGFVKLDGVGTLATVVRAKRDHTLELHQPARKTGDADGITTLKLEGVNRPPQSMLGADVDQDGFTDLMLFTPGEPMVLVRATPGDASKGGDPAKGTLTQVLVSEKMANFGLVQAAGPNNTALADVDGDAKPELLIADKNFVRACRYDAKAGWKVVSQVTINDPGTDLVGLTVLAGASGGELRVVASDKGNNRLLFIDPSAKAGGVRERVRLSGFSPGAIFSGAFGGDAQAGLLAVADDAFGLLRLAGQRVKLDSFATYRSDAKDRAEFDLELGDINNDGFMDAVVVDSAEQMCTILTFSQLRRVQLATEFKLYQSRLFSGGDGREFEPREVSIGDFTGRGRNDLLLLIHDRIMIYPSQSEPSEKTPAAKN